MWEPFKFASDKYAELLSTLADKSDLSDEVVEQIPHQRLGYQTGSQELIELQRILVATPGVFGARFSGAGFGGCSVALVEAEEAEKIRSSVEKAFLHRFPHLAGRARAFLVESEDGARLV